MMSLSICEERLGKAGGIRSEAAPEVPDDRGVTVCSVY
jgi:hypothetical protein